MAQSAKELMALGIGQRLRAAREKAGLSQEGLARETKPALSREVIRRAEAGNRIPEWGNLEKIAKALGISLWDLLPSKPEDSFRVAPRRAGEMTIAA